jgi:hypothetical protein
MEPFFSKLDDAVGPWGQEIKAWLKDLNLPPTREAEVVEELAQHAEDRYQEMLGDGLTESEASRATLAEVRQVDLLRGLKRVERYRSQRAVLGSGGSRNPIVIIWQKWGNVLIWIVAILIVLAILFGPKFFDSTRRRSLPGDGRQRTY